MPSGSDAIGVWLSNWPELLYKAPFRPGQTCDPSYPISRYANQSLP